MKTPEQVFTEITADEIKCFHGHTVSWNDFVKCCESLKHKHYGVDSCMWMILRSEGMKEDTIRILRACDHITKEAQKTLLTPAFRLERTFDEKMKPWMDPRRLVSFETEQEILDWHSSMRKVISFPDLNFSQLERMKRLHQKYLNTRVTYSIRAGSRYKIGVQLGEKRSAYTLTMKDIIDYLRELSGKAVTEITRWPQLVALVGKQTIAFEVLCDEARFKKLRITLDSLGSCTVEHLSEDRTTKRCPRPKGKV